MPSLNEFGAGFVDYYLIRENAGCGRGIEGRDSLAMRYSRALAAYTADPQSTTRRSVPESRSIPYQVPVRELARTYQQEPFVPSYEVFTGETPRGQKSALSACRLCGRYVVLWSFVVASLISLGMIVLEGVHRDDFALQIVNGEGWKLSRREGLRTYADFSGEKSDSGYAFILN